MGKTVEGEVGVDMREVEVKDIGKVKGGRFITAVRRLILRTKGKEVGMKAIQHTEDTKDVPSGKRGWHRPMALEYARHWNMQQAHLPGPT